MTTNAQQEAFAIGWDDDNGGDECCLTIHRKLENGHQTVELMVHGDVARFLIGKIVAANRTTPQGMGELESVVERCISVLKEGRVDEIRAANLARWLEDALQSTEKPVVGEWLPIKSAPKKAKILIGCFIFGEWYFRQGDKDTLVGNGSAYEKPTHWQPLPLPPTTSEKDAK